MNNHLLFMLLVSQVTIARAQMPSSTAGTLSDTCHADYTYIISGLDVTFTNLSDPLATEYGYSWDFGDGAMSILESPSHIYSEAGYYNVCLLLSTDSCNDEYCTVIGLATATDHTEGTVMNIYPVPSDHYFSIDFMAPASQNIRICLINSTGIPVKNIFSGNINAGRQIFTVDISGLHPGIYFMQVCDPENNSTLQQQLVVY